MGMVLAFFIAVYILICVLIYKFIITKKTDKKWIKIVSIIIFTLIPTYDIIITNLLGFYYYSTTQKPFINADFKEPISLYVENDISPFTENNKEYLAYNYLCRDWSMDNVKIDKVAFKSSDEKIYIYHYSKKEDAKFNAQTKILRERELSLKKDRDEIYNKINNFIFENEEEKVNFKREIDKKNEQLLEISHNIDKIQKQIIMDTLTITTKNSMPILDYTIKIKHIKLNKFVSNFIYIDKAELIDNTTMKLVGYNQWLLRYNYNFLPSYVFGGINKVEMYNKYRIIHKIFDISSYD